MIRNGGKAANTNSISSETGEVNEKKNSNHPETTADQLTNVASAETPTIYTNADSTNDETANDSDSDATSVLSQVPDTSTDSGASPTPKLSPSSDFSSTPDQGPALDSGSDLEPDQDLDPDPEPDSNPGSDPGSDPDSSADSDPIPDSEPTPSPEHGVTTTSKTFTISWILFDQIVYVDSITCPVDAYGDVTEDVYYRNMYFPDGYPKGYDYIITAWVVDSLDSNILYDSGNNSINMKDYSRDINIYGYTI